MNSKQQETNMGKTGERPGSGLAIKHFFTTSRMLHCKTWPHSHDPIPSDPIPSLAAETVTTADGSAYPIDYANDPDGLLTEASAVGRTLTLTRDADNGALIATALGTVTTEHGDNAFGEPETVTALHGPDTLFAARYTRDNLGRITGIQETILAPEPGQGGAAPRAPPVTSTLTYTYDAADRLQSWSRDGQVQETYGYDPNGNRTHVNGAQVATYDDQDRLVVYTPIHPRPVPSAAVGYRIDLQQRRIARTENGAVTHLWVYRDDLNPIAELHPDGSLKSLFVYADQANTPAFLVRIDRDTGASTTYRYVTDHLGSPRLLVDTDTGAIAQRLDYDPWGRVTQDTHPGFQPFGFAGGLYDPATGLVRFGARDYDPFTGRWTAKDPIGFDGDGRNLYGYVLGDTVNWGDETGEGRARRGGGNPRTPGLGPNGRQGTWHRGQFYPSMGTPWQRPDRSGYSRPSGFRKGVREKVWQEAVEPKTGRVRDPLSGRFMGEKKPWDMGHRPGHEFRKHQQSAAERCIDRQL
jgi:RHS repeat-associated protein